MRGREALGFGRGAVRRPASRLSASIYILRRGAEMTKEGTIIVFVDNMDDIVNFDFLEAYGGYLVYEVPRDDGATWGKLMSHSEKSTTTVILMTRNIRFIWFMASAIEGRRQAGEEIPGNVFFVNITRIVHVNGLGDVTVRNEYEVRSLEKEEIPSIRQ
jgi:hypothetical protein